MSEKEHQKKNIFFQGPIPPEKIATMITNHQSKTHIGAHEVFMGQVRADEKDGQKVAYIDYTAYEDMALEVCHQIREEVFAKYKLACMHILHSLGHVPAGQISLLVFVSSAHRTDCRDACSELVERIKKELPVWGKEVFENEQASWKVNT